MANERVIGQSGREAIYKSNSGGIRFKMRTTGRSPELAMIAHSDPNFCLYKLTLGHVTTVYNTDDKEKETFPSRDLYDLHEFREFYLTWHNNKIKLGLVGGKEIVDYQKKYADPIVGYIQFKTQTRNSRPVEWVIETSPVILKSLSSKKFCDRLHWRPLIDGKLPSDAMIGGFEYEPIYIARAYHNNSLCPGKYVKSVGLAFISWGGQEHPKEDFEVLCGYNCKWIKTSSNYIPQNAFIGGYSEVNREPLYLGRTKIHGNLLCGKVHLLYKKCYLPYQGGEFEVSVYEILVIPDDEIPQAISLPALSKIE